MDGQDPSREPFRRRLFREGRALLATAFPATSPASSPEDDSVEAEFRRQVFRVAAGRVRGEFAGEEWSSFWQTRVRRRPVAEVAESLGIPESVVHRARSRVMPRVLREMDRIEGLAGPAADGAS